MKIQWNALWLSLGARKCQHWYCLVPDWDMASCFFCRLILLIAVSSDNIWHLQFCIFRKWCKQLLHLKILHLLILFLKILRQWYKLKKKENKYPKSYSLIETTNIHLLKKLGSQYNVTASFFKFYDVKINSIAEYYLASY